MLGHLGWDVRGRRVRRRCISGSIRIASRVRSRWQQARGRCLVPDTEKSEPRVGDCARSSVAGGRPVAQIVGSASRQHELEEGESCAAGSVLARHKLQLNEWSSHTGISQTRLVVWRRHLTGRHGCDAPAVCPCHETLPFLRPVYAPR